MSEVTDPSGEVPHPRLRAYREYKDSGVEWLGEIPAHWQSLALGRVTISRCDGPFGSGLKSEHYSESGIRVVRLQNIGWAEFADLDAAYLDEAYARQLGDHGVKGEDILIAGLGDDGHPVGRACVAPVEIEPAMVKADCFRFRLDRRRILPRYAAFQLSATATAVAGRYATGATRARMNLATSASRKITLPPLKEQEAIAAFLDRETAKIDALVARKERLIELLHEKRTALITRAVTRGLDPNVPMKDSGVEWLGEIPAHWDVCRLRRAVCKFVDYRGKTPEKSASGVPLVTARNIKNQSIDFSLSEEFIPEELYPQWMVRGRPERGDVVITTEAPLGETAQVVDTGIALAQRVILLKVEATKITNDYLKCHFAADSGRMELRTRATGSTALGIKASHLKSSLIAVPSMCEQNEISRTVRNESEEVDVLIAKVREAIGQLTEFRTALISAAVTGKIDVREAVPR